MKSLTQTHNSSTARVQCLFTSFSNYGAQETVTELEASLKNNEITTGMYYLVCYQMASFAASVSGQDTDHILKRISPKAYEASRNRRMVFDCLMNGAHNELFGTDLDWFAEEYETNPHPLLKSFPFLLVVNNDASACGGFSA